MLDALRPGYYISESRGPIPVTSMNSVHLANALKKAVRMRDAIAAQVDAEPGIPLYELYLANPSLKALVDEAAARDLPEAQDFFHKLLES